MTIGTEPCHRIEKGSACFQIAAKMAKSSGSNDHNPTANPPIVEIDRKYALLNGTLDSAAQADDTYRASRLSRSEHVEDVTGSDAVSELDDDRLIVDNILARAIDAAIRVG